MNKERIKSFILILLILSSVYLTAQLWSDSKLWPEGNFFDFMKNTAFVRTISTWINVDDVQYDGKQLYLKTTKPRRVVVNGGGAREIYLKESDYYNEAMQYADALLSEMKKSGVTSSAIDYEEWKALFKSKSLYIDYGYLMNFYHLNSLYGLNSEEGKFQKTENFSGFIIVPNNITNNCSVYMLNEEDNTVTEHSFFADVSNLYNFIEKTTYQKHQNDTFAFEINLDVLSSAQEELQRQVSFSPLTLLTIPTESEKYVVLQSNKIFTDSEEFESFSEKALNIFGYSASSLRKNVQSDGTITFVENGATISFYTDGTIDYQAVSRNNGLKMSDTAPSSNGAVSDVLRVTATVWEKSGIETKNFDYHLVSDLEDNRENKYIVKIDNMFDGTVINYSNISNNAIYAEVDEGYITKLVIHLSNITASNQNTDTVPVLMAIDRVYSRYGNSGMIIDDVYKCYDFDKSGKGVAKWAFKVRGDENLLLMDMSELN